VHGSDKEIEIKDEEEEEKKPEVRRRVKSEDTPNVKVEGTLGDTSKGHGRSASEYGEPRSATADGRWTFEHSQASLPSPPASRGCRSLSPPAPPSLLPSMVPPRVVSVKLVFPNSSELPDMYANIKFTQKMSTLLSRIATWYGVDEKVCHEELRLVCSARRVTNETAGELVDYDEVGTNQDPLVVDVLAGAGSEPACMVQDYERYRMTGMPLPRYRDKVLRILKPLPTDPYLPWSLFDDF